MPAIRVRPEESLHDMYLLSWTSPQDAHYAIYNIFASHRWPPVGGNNGYYKNERVDELIRLGAIETDPAKRLIIYHEAQELIWEDAPWIFLHEETEIVANRSNVKNAFRGSTPDLRNAYIE